MGQVPREPPLISVAAAPASYPRHTRRRRYQRPPVHEVVLSLVFGDGVDPSALESLPKILADQYPEAHRQHRHEFAATLGPAGQQLVSSSNRERDGWFLRSPNRTRLVSAGRMHLNLHAVREGEWPTGEYAGWEAIYREAGRLFSELEAVYGQAQLQRAGLRYLNRIAVPTRSDLEEWFTIGFRAPKFLQDEYAINLRETWASVEGSEDLSITLGLATIQIPEPALAEGHVGFLLDCEVFNLWKKYAPSYAELPRWCRRAHEAEGDIFESSITDKLRRQLGVVD